MQWFICLVLFALSTEKGTAKNQTLAYCKGYFSEHSFECLDTNQMLGVWYKTFDKPDDLYCITIENITEEYRKSITAELKPYTNENSFSRFTLVVKRTCPEKVGNTTEFHLLAPLGDKGVFNTFYAPVLRNLTHIMSRISYPVMFKNLEFNGQEYLGFMTCFDLIFKEPPDDRVPLIFARKIKENYDNAEIKHLQQVFVEGNIKGKESF